MTGADPALAASWPVVEGHQLLVGPVGVGDAPGPDERNVSCSCGAWSGVTGAAVSGVLATRAAWLQHVANDRGARRRQVSP